MLFLCLQIYINKKQQYNRLYFWEYLLLLQKNL